MAQDCDPVGIDLRMSRKRGVHSAIDLPAHVFRQLRRMAGARHRRGQDGIAGASENLRIHAGGQAAAPAQRVGPRHPGIDHDDQRKQRAILRPCRQIEPTRAWSPRSILMNDGLRLGECHIIQMTVQASDRPCLITDLEPDRGDAVVDRTTDGRRLGNSEDLQFLRPCSP